MSTAQRVAALTYRRGGRHYDQQSFNDLAPNDRRQQHRACWERGGDSVAPAAAASPAGVGARSGIENSAA